MVDSKTEPPGRAERLKAQNMRYAEEAETARLAAQKSLKMIKEHIKTLHEVEQGQLKKPELMGCHFYPLCRTQKLYQKL